MPNMSNNSPSTVKYINPNTTKMQKMRIRLPQYVKNISATTAASSQQPEANKQPTCSTSLTGHSAETQLQVGRIAVMRSAPEQASYALYKDLGLDAIFPASSFCCRLELDRQERPSHAPLTATPASAPCARIVLLPLCVFMAGSGGERLTKVLLVRSCCAMTVFGLSDISAPNTPRLSAKHTHWAQACLGAGIRSATHLRSARAPR